MSWFDVTSWSWPWSKPVAPAAPVEAEAPLSPPPADSMNSGTAPALTGARRRKTKRSKKSKKGKSKRSRTGRKSTPL